MDHPHQFHRARRTGSATRRPGAQRPGRAPTGRRGAFGWLLVPVLMIGALLGSGAAERWGFAGPVAVRAAEADGGVRLGLAAVPGNAEVGAGETVRGVRFGLCHRGGGRNCVVDGDTFWIGGEKIRIADIDAPETHPPRCPTEARLGAAATARLRALLNAGPVTLVTGERDSDRYGRALRTVTRDGESLGATLVAEGLARTWRGRREPWC